MLILHVSIHVKPECVEPFRTATIENARNSVREPGIARFDFLQHADDPNRFSLLKKPLDTSLRAPEPTAPRWQK